MIISIIVWGLLVGAFSCIPFMGLELVNNHQTDAVCTGLAGVILVLIAIALRMPT